MYVLVLHSKFSEPKSKRDNATRHWVFTLNNPLPDEEKGAWLQDSEYWVIGKEVGEQGTPHLQGYVVYMDRYRLKQIQDSHPVAKRAHWEPQSQFSTPRQASDYCKKEGNFLEHGEWYLFVHDITDPDFDLHSSSDSNTSGSSYESEEEEDDYKPLARTKTASMHIQTCDAQFP